MGSLMHCGNPECGFVWDGRPVPEMRLRTLCPVCEVARVCAELVRVTAEREEEPTSPRWDPVR